MQTLTRDPSENRFLLSIVDDDPWYKRLWEALRKGYENLTDENGLVRRNAGAAIDALKEKGKSAIESLTDWWNNRNSN